MVASCRVKMTTSLFFPLGWTLPKVIDLPPPLPLDFLSEVASSCITTRFCLRSSATASALVAALMVPSTVLPLGPLAAYLKLLTCLRCVPGVSLRA